MSKILELSFPAAGVERRLGFRDSLNAKDSFPAPWAMNVRLQDSLADRLRGGSFTGISAGDRPSSIVYRDRTLTFSDNAITASRVGDSTDITMDADISDLQRPTVFQLSHGGAEGGVVKALVPHEDQFLLCFTADETWVQQGDPLGGPRRQVSDEVGIIGADAWCIVGNTVYFLSSLGLYSVGVDGGGLEALSEDAIPEDLTGISDTACTLTYQHSDRGVYIHHTGTNWFYDVSRKQFWPFDTSKTDSHVILGPIKLGRRCSYGRVDAIYGMVATGSDDIDWHIIPGETAEEAAANAKAVVVSALGGGGQSGYVRGNGTWSAGRSHSAYPRTRAMWACLWLSSTGTWAYEGVTLKIMPTGYWR